MLNDTVRKVTDGIVRRSGKNRDAYLARLEEERAKGPSRHRLPCSNLAHGMAVCTDGEGAVMRQAESAAIAIFSSYNDVLSAHHTYEHYPALLKEEVRVVGEAGGDPPGRKPVVARGECRECRRRCHSWCRDVWATCSSA